MANSRFEPFFARFAAGVAKRTPKRLSAPEDVAALVYQAATEQRAKPMYRINNGLFLKIMGRLPTRLVDWLIARDLRTAAQATETAPASAP